MASLPLNPGREHPSNKRLRAASLPYAVGKGLEVGPFDRPFFLKEETDVEYLDYRSGAELREFAKIAPGHNAEFVPDMDYVVPPDGSWALVPDARFQWILSSHALEHCPDIIGMFNTIARKLELGGAVITMLPDKRCTFDAHRAVTSLGQVIEDHLRSSTINRAQAVFDGIYYSRSLSISDARKEYEGARDSPPAGGDFNRAIEAARVAVSSYVDAHNYVFTAESYKHICDVLCENDIIPFDHIDFQHAPDDDMTFFSVMRKR